MTFNFIAFIPRIIFLVIALLACVILIRMMINSKLEVKDIQAEVLVQGFLYGPGGVTYYDPVTGRVYPEIVDTDQWNESKYNLAFSFLPENQFIAAKISLAKDKKVSETVKFGKPGWKEFLGGPASVAMHSLANSQRKYVATYDFIATTYYNKEYWDFWEPLAKSRIKGLGGVDIDTTEVPVLYRDEDDELRSGFLYIVILQPK